MGEDAVRPSSGLLGDQDAGMGLCQSTGLVMEALVDPRSSLFFFFVCLLRAACGILVP